MYKDEKIGVGIVTYNRQDGLMKLFKSLPLDLIDELIIVNDGEYFENSEIDKSFIIHNKENLGVGKSKNIILNILKNKAVDHFFIIEDDVFIKSVNIFEQYILASKITGIQHLNYAHHQSIKKPKATLNYPLNIKMSSFHQCYAAFSYYSKQCIEQVGFMDETFFNALEHLDHTLQIINHNMHPAFYDFMDIENSFDYIQDFYQDGYQSVISNGHQHNEILENAHTYFFKKHQVKINDIPQDTGLELIECLQDIFDTYSEYSEEYLITPDNLEDFKQRVYKEMKKYLRHRHIAEAQKLKVFLLKNSSIMGKIFYHFQWALRYKK
ncbi:MAG: hypothetical protein QM666_04430 [Acinetobacter sp.]